MLTEPVLGGVRGTPVTRLWEISLLITDFSAFLKTIQQTYNQAKCGVVPGNKGLDFGEGEAGMALTVHRKLKTKDNLIWEGLLVREMRLHKGIELKYRL